MPRGETCYVSREYQGCPVLVEDVVMLANLVPLDIVDFDVILGMDWLHYNRAKLDCYEKAVRAKKLLRKECQGYLVHVVLNEDTSPRVEDVRVVRHFPDVFPDELPGLPPDREVEFAIDLILALPDDSGNFEIYTDAFLNGLGCVLMQYGKWQMHLAEKSRSRISALHACRIPLLTEVRSIRVDLEVEDREEALLTSFRVRPILIDCVLEAQMNDAESQELIQVVSDGKKKDLKIRNSDGMLMQGNRMFTSKFWVAFQEALGSRLLYSTTYHPQTDRQSERTIQTLEDVLRASVLQFGDAWHKHLALSIGERVLVDPEIVDKTTQNIQVIKANLKADQDRQKSIANKHATDRVYKVGDWITERVGEVAYRLELPPKLSKVHDVFHVSMLHHYVSDSSHVIPPQPLEINLDVTYDEEPVTILDWKDKVLRNKTVRMVKVLWRNHLVEKATWETEERMRDLYPRLFYGY
ncbi:uncharacterized protein [Pyrus communis]|uniref:uncharacterized protein n=1 Tax=Pyrus communis TaxID=23211 RepID=UPI0035BFCB4B